MKWAPKLWKQIQALKNETTASDGKVLAPMLGLEQLGWNISAHGVSSEVAGPIPWLTYAATDFLDQVVALDSSVLEIGGGSSTKFWMNRGNSVTVLEQNVEYVAALARICPNVIHLETGSDVENWCTAASRARLQFDVVVADGFNPRSTYLAKAACLVAATGILVVDNSDRQEVQQSLIDIESRGYVRLDFFGLGPINMYAWMTTVFFNSGFEFRQTLRRTYSTVEY